jgi:hypothetical protein
MRRRALLVGLIMGLAALAAFSAIAGAQSVERVQIGDSARRAHGLPPGLFVELVSPADYNRQSVSGASGFWQGPRWEEQGNPGNAGYSSAGWTVTFEEGPGDPQAVALAHVQHVSWQRDQKEGFSVAHVVGKRVVGSLKGYYVMMTPGGGDARFEAVLAFPLDTNLNAIVRLDFLEPASDSYLVNGSIVGSTWNRGQAFLSLSGVHLQGNLPPKIVSAHTFERGRVIKGKVVDRFLDAVLGAPVALERQAGGSWTRVSHGKTSQQGSYSLQPSRRGLYRVTVRMAGFTATSREFRAGR